MNTTERNNLIYALYYSMPGIYNAAEHESDQPVALTPEWVFAAAIVDLVEQYHTSHQQG